jgi:CheY-like chemotaxis protein
MVDVKALKALCEGRSVLYVEDEAAVRDALAKQLRRLFETVYVAENGQEGLRLFSQHRPDLTISDIRMPVMDGLAMTRAIKAIDATALVVITTAHSDEGYLLDAIDIGVDRYLLKPVDIQKLKEALYVAAMTLRDREMARELEQRKLQDRINENAEAAAGAVLRAVPIATVLMAGDKPLFMNDAFAQLLGGDRLEAFSGGRLSLEDLLLAKSGYLCGLDEYDDKKENKAYLKTASGTRIFRLFIYEVALQSGQGSRLYSLIDITLSEYQKIKLENYAQRLADLLLRQRQTPAAQVAPESTGEKGGGHKPLLSLEEEAHLRRSHTVKTDAKTYVAELGDGVRELVDELGETEQEMADLIAEYNSKGDATVQFQTIGRHLSHYADVIAQLFEFEGLGHAIGSLSALLADLQPEELQGGKDAVLLRYLESIRLDLSTWRDTLFISQNTVDIHYLDSSLLSSALQAQLAIRGGEEGEGELELF